ncbi:MAG TPA: HAD hydrolase family protein [Clostridiales bacterium]|jgi:mannosyl-3-phosphoglycerate synthase|nr:HAD hydrolase family protein [Clostridiales bacterium]HQP70000.1 HAD hydrolase family protein [Clostridiales bacterium]
MKKTIIFSDIDGTFIDSSYNIVFSRTFLKKTADKFRIVFVSSRTAEEIIYLQNSTGLKGDFIAENGSVLGFFDPPVHIKNSVISETLKEHHLIFTGKCAVELLSETESILKKLNIKTVILNKLEPDTAAVFSDYDKASAIRSLSRRATVLFRSEIPTANSALADEFRRSGISLVFGGKWLSASTGFDKGEAVKYYIKTMNIDPEMTAGVGNSDNDFSLLNAVSKKFIINNDGYNEKLNTIENAVKLKQPGTKGWKEMISILSEVHEVR